MFRRHTHGSIPPMPEGDLAEVISLSDHPEFVGRIALTDGQPAEPQRLLIDEVPQTAERARELIERDAAIVTIPQLRYLRHERELAKSPKGSPEKDAQQAAIDALLEDQITARSDKAERRKIVRLIRDGDA